MWLKRFLKRLGINVMDIHCDSEVATSYVLDPNTTKDMGLSGVQNSLHSGVCAHRNDTTAFVANAGKLGDGTRLACGLKNAGTRCPTPERLSASLSGA